MRTNAARGAEEACVLGAMLSLAGSLGWLAVHPRLLEGHFYRTPVMALTHVATLGWISLMIQGVLLRLTPMALGVAPRSRKLAFAVFGTWTVGAAGLIVHMGQGQWYGTWTAGLLLFVAALLLPVLHSGVFRRAREGDWVAVYAAAAMLHLILAAGAGILIAMNKHLAWFPLSPYRALAVHFHLAQVGWVTFMILGFGRKLLPVLAPPREREPWESRIRFLLLEGGLLLLVLGWIAAPPVVAPASVVLAAGIGIHVARPVTRLVRGRVRDRSSVWGAVACLALLADALLGVALATGLAERWGGRPDRVLLAYGIVALLGWNLLSTSAYGMKLFPLWVWEERFAGDLGVRPVPSMPKLLSAAAREATGIGLAGGTALAGAGALAGSLPLLAWGIRLAAAGGFLFLFNFVRVARWGLLPLAYRPGPEDLERHRAYLAAMESAGRQSPSPGGDREP